LSYRAKQLYPGGDAERRAGAEERKIARAEILGYYNPAWLGEAAYIELYVDKICRPLPRPLNWIPLVRDLVVGRVLFHEIGHHIHSTTRPEHREREDVADEWGERLLRTAILKRHRYARLLRPLYRAILFLYTKYGANA